jgi:5'(3')-deoxyribonucleotidase
MTDTFDYDNNLKKTIAVDFDNVIHDMNQGWKKGEIYGEQVDGSVEAIKKLQQFGYEVIVFTARVKLEPVKEWLKEWNLKVKVTNQKPPAIAYIDDRAIRFTNWPDILRYFI